MHIMDDTANIDQLQTRVQRLERALSWIESESSEYVMISPCVNATESDEDGYVILKPKITLDHALLKKKSKLLMQKIRERIMAHVLNKSVDEN